ncbi:MAG: dipeptide epimerase [Planctomycetaceae bacterium]|jgi:L-alanine-DL-glutamate epimerase-like enolase superfamily enzyme|nr:dipeptide epimerase [Planctomycetaceae bacterium]
MKLRTIRIDLPLKHVFGSSKGRTVSVVRTVVVVLEQDGLCGYGEAYEDAYYNVTVEKILEAVDRIREDVEGYALADPIAFWRYLTPQLERNPFARAAVDIAAYDLWGKMKNKPLWQIWGTSIETAPISSHSIGIDSTVMVTDKFRECPDWSLYRIKLGGLHDDEMLLTVRSMTTAPFRVDVNGGWTVEQAIDMLPLLREMNVELIEQPLKYGDHAGMKKLRQKCQIPIIADESLRTADELEKCAEEFDGVNIKPLKFGGITPVRQLIDKARKLGLKVMMGNSVESTIGASTTAQFAPQLDYTYLDGPLLIEKKVGEVGVQLEKGRIIYPDECGTGFALRSTAPRYIYR